MANSKSAEKRIRQNTVRAARNRKVRSRIRTFVNNFEKALEAGDVAQAEERFRSAESELSRAASKGVIPATRAARKASRMAKGLERLRTNA